MANWCSSLYIFEGDTTEIKDIFDKLSSLQVRETSLMENGFGKNWLGNIVALLGGNPDEVACRGTYESVEISNDTLVLYTDTAWDEMRPTWDFVCQQYKTLRYYFRAEEPGGEYFVTNDRERKYFPDRYLLEQNEQEPMYFETEAALFAEVEKRTDTSIRNWDAMQAVIDEYNENDEDDCPIVVGAFEIVD